MRLRNSAKPLDLTLRRLYNECEWDLAIKTKRMIIKIKYCPTNNSRFSLYLFRSNIFELFSKNIIFVKRKKKGFVCLFVWGQCFFSFGLVFSCSWNESKCIGVFDIAVRIIIIVINTIIIIIVAIYIQGTLLVEVDFIIITCRSSNTFPMPCQGFVWFLLLPKYRIKACNLPPNPTALPCAAYLFLNSNFGKVLFSSASRFPSHQSFLCSFCRLRTVVLILRKSRGKECGVADNDAWYWLLYSTGLATVF